MAGGADVLRAYHERTKHSLERLRANPHGLDWAIMPRPFKVYADLEPSPLPRDLTSSTAPVLAAIAGDVPPPAEAPGLDRAALARLLYFSAGVLRHRHHPGGGEVFFRAAACTGALFHVDLYVVCAALPDLEAGVHHFGPHDFALRRLRAGDHRGALDAATGGHPAVREAPLLLVYTSTFWRNAWKYRERAYRHCFWDAGTILANLLALTSAGGLPATVVQGFVDADVNALLDVDPMHEAALGVVALGTGAAPPPPAPNPGPLDLETLPLSSRQVDYAAIREAHGASELASSADVAAWRAEPAVAASPLDGGAAVRLEPPPAGAVPEPVETVILRRGSARRFGAEPIAQAQLAAIIHAATRAVPADVAPVPELYLIVHAVEGLEPGTYAASPDGARLAPLRSGLFRREAGFLGLGQSLPAEAAANLYWLIDLERVFAAHGGRGYRAAQLMAAIAGGRTYLAAYAQGLGATGLTFFDDDVTEFFSPHAAGKSVLFLMAVGRRVRRGA